MINIPLLILIIVSLLIGVLAAVVYKVAGNQGKIKSSNNRIKAFILEIRLFDHEPLLIIRATAGVFKNLPVYLFYTLKPVIVLIIPVVIILFQLHLYYSYSPFKAGDVSVVTIKIEDGNTLTRSDIKLAAPENVKIVSLPVFSASLNEFSWKIEMLKPGKGELVFKIKDRNFSKNIYVSDSMERICPSSEKKSSYKKITYFLFDGLPGDGKVESINVEYPPGEMKMFGANIHWLVVFLIFSLISGVIIMKVFGISW